MQSKRFEASETITIPTLTGINSLIIENEDEHRINYHGIRFKGRILKDDVTHNTYQNGYIALLCVPNDFIPITGIFNTSDMEKMNQMIIALEPWSLQSGASGRGDTTSMYDFDIAPKTSRTCSKGGKIIGQITNEGLGSVVLTTLLTTFSTTV